MTDPNRIPVGYVRRAHGIRGDVVVRGLISDADARLVTGAELETGDADRRRYVVTAHRAQKGDVVLHLDGVDDRNRAEELVGTQFVTTASDRRALDVDEWWAEDLVGCQVVDTSGTVIGSIIDVTVGAAQDRLTVETNDGTQGDVPFVDELVPTVDPEANRVVVDLPDGLFG